MTHQHCAHVVYSVVALGNQVGRPKAVAVPVARIRRQAGQASRAKATSIGSGLGTLPLAGYKQAGLFDWQLGETSASHSAVHVCMAYRLPCRAYCCWCRLLWLIVSFCHVNTRGLAAESGFANNWQTDHVTFKCNITQSHNLQTADFS